MKKLYSYCSDYTLEKLDEYRNTTLKKNNHAYYKNQIEKK